ncbi:hypothetical protein Plhal304r1_c053g0137981 [Plasmopara halstedii]
MHKPCVPDRQIILFIPRREIGLSEIIHIGRQCYVETTTASVATVLAQPRLLTLPSCRGFGRR